MCEHNNFNLRNKVTLRVTNGETNCFNILIWLYYSPLLLSTRHKIPFLQRLLLWLPCNGFYLFYSQANCQLLKMLITVILWNVINSQRKTRDFDFEKLMMVDLIHSYYQNVHIHSNFTESGSNCSPEEFSLADSIISFSISTFGGSVFWLSPLTSFDFRNRAT